MAAQADLKGTKRSLAALNKALSTSEVGAGFQHVGGVYLTLPAFPICSLSPLAPTLCWVLQGGIATELHSTGASPHRHVSDASASMDAYKATVKQLATELLHREGQLASTLSEV